MSLNLIDDCETFEAALHFVDEYVESAQDDADFTSLNIALEGLPSPPELDTQSDALQPTSAPQTAPKLQAHRARKNSKSTASKPKRPPHYNPNRARDQQRKELLYLREKVVELEQEVKTLRSTRRPRTHQRLEGDTGKEKDAGNLPASSKFRAHEVWREMASHQLEQRLKSERENLRLKAVLEGQIKIGKSLAKLLEATSTTQPMKSCVYGLERTRRIYASAPDRTGPGIFAELMAGVNDSYHEVDDLFRSNGLVEMESSFSDAKMRTGPGGVYMEMLDNKVLPFDVASTESAVWKYFANSMERKAYRCFDQNDPQDNIAESFGLELHVKGMQADFRVKQILRRYVEDDRVVIVWRSFIDPYKFSGIPLRGAEFLEKGYIVVRRPRGMADNFAMLQTCYLVHPTTSVYSLSEGGITKALTDFKLSRTAANIAARHQMIENTLFDQATRRTGTQCLTLEGVGW